MISVWIASISHSHNAAGRWRRMFSRRDLSLGTRLSLVFFSGALHLKALISFWRCEICCKECTEAWLLREGLGNLPGAFPCKMSTCICEELVLMNDVVPAKSAFLIVQISPRAAWLCAASCIRFSPDPNDQCVMVGKYVVLLKISSTSQPS